MNQRFPRFAKNNNNNSENIPFGILKNIHLLLFIVSNYIFQNKNYNLKLNECSDGIYPACGLYPVETLVRSPKVSGV